MTSMQRYIDLETAELRKTEAADNLDKYHAETKAWRDKKVLRKNINVGDMVLIRHADKQGKLQPQWYGPFIVSQKIGQGAFKLMSEEGTEMAHTWNADNLRRFYP